MSMTAMAILLAGIANSATADTLQPFLEKPEAKRTLSIYAGDMDMGQQSGHISLIFGYIKDKRIKMGHVLDDPRPDDLCERARRNCERMLPGHDFKAGDTGDFGLVPLAREMMFKPEGVHGSTPNHFGLKLVYQFQ